MDVIYSFNLNMYAIFLGIFTGLGKQGTLGMICVMYLWVLGLPMTYYCAVIQGGGLKAVWDTMYLVYVAINITLCASLLWTDWEDIAIQIRIREGWEQNRPTLSKNDTIPVASYDSL
jgi:Na+-driven multidrug efflux pump